MQCLDCHTSRKHKVAGGSDLKAQELLDVKVACENCHNAPHKGEKAKALDRPDRLPDLSYSDDRPGPQDAHGRG